MPKLMFASLIKAAKAIPKKYIAMRQKRQMPVKYQKSLLLTSN